MMPCKGKRGELETQRMHLQPIMQRKGIGVARPRNHCSRRRGYLTGDVIMGKEGSHVLAQSRGK